MLQFKFLINEIVNESERWIKFFAIFMFRRRAAQIEMKFCQVRDEKVTKNLRNKAYLENLSWHYYPLFIARMMEFLSLFSLNVLIPSSRSCNLFKNNFLTMKIESAKEPPRLNWMGEWMTNEK